MTSSQHRSQHVQQLDSAEVDCVEATNSQQTYQSYRQTRRTQQSQRTNGRKSRGQTRGVKWKNERNHRLGTKPSFNITSDMKRIVGANAYQFITEVGTMVRTMLPLNCRRWNDMDSDHKQRLLNRIKAEWNLPEGDNVDQAVSHQCQALYRNWRYRLKEKFFDGFSIAEALKKCPEEAHPDQWKWIVEKHWGSEKQKRKNHHFANTSSQASEHATQNVEEGNAASQEATVGTNQLPPPPPHVLEYIRLWEMTKRHKDNSWDTLAEQRLEEFKELHEQQLEFFGVDDLIVQEAYMKVLGTSSGYINGLGFGPKPPKGRKEGRSDGEGIQIAHQMAQQLELLEKNSREREAQLKEQLENDSREREHGLKGQIQ